MTALELATLIDAGLAPRQIRRLALIRWLVRRGAIREGAPGDPLPEMPAYVIEEEAAEQANAWVPPGRHWLWRR